MRSKNVLLICGSRKPAPNQVDKKSAARELLKLLHSYIQNRIVRTIDLRDLNLPMFDGRTVEEYESEDLEWLMRRVKSAYSIVVSAPAYWGGASGVFKNALDLLGGVAYDQPEQHTPFEGKIVGLLVVGADNHSAFNASSQLRTIFSSMGAIVLNMQVVIGNPRKTSNPN